MLFWTFCSSKIPENKCITISTKILNSTTVFNIDNNKIFFPEHQISILEWSLKDVTLKTVCCNNISQYIGFFPPIYAALVSIGDEF